MTEMLERQQNVEARTIPAQWVHQSDETPQDETIDHLSYLHEELRPLEELHHKYTSYRSAYSKLVLELARRNSYREGVQKTVATMTKQLNAIAEGASRSFADIVGLTSWYGSLEERLIRADFKAEHVQYLPDDFCLHVDNLPNCWVVTTANNEPLETLPIIEQDLIEEVSAVPLY